MALKDCAAELGRVMGRTITEAEAAQLMGLVEDRAKVMKAEGAYMTAQERLHAAAGQLGDEALAAAAIEKRNRLLNFSKRINRDAFYKEAPDAVLGMEAKLVGVNTVKQGWNGSRYSVDNQGRTLSDDYVGGLTADLDEGGFTEVVRRGAMDDAVAKELYELSLGEKGTPGITKNKDAASIAGLFHKYQRLAVENLNRAGAWIGEYAGYISRTTHDPDRIRRAGHTIMQRKVDPVKAYQSWRDTIVPLLDADKTFEGVEDTELFLHGVYNALVDGVHLTHDGLTGFKDPAFKGPGNLAKRMSQGRKLHFRDADAWMRYRDAFGYKRPLVQDIMENLRHSAQSTALMREFGTNPRAEFEADFRRLTERAHLAGDTATVLRLQKNRKMLENRFAVIDGTVNMPGNRQAANIVSGVRTWVSMTKMGAVLAAQFGDLLTGALELRYQGLNLLEAYGNGLNSIIRGRGGKGTVRRAVAESTRAGLQGATSSVMTRFDVTSDVVPGTMARAANRFFKLAGMTYWVDAMRTGLSVAMARNLGLNRGRQWATLDPRIRRVLSMFDIGEGEWNMLRTLDWKQADGRNYLTPNLVDNLTDDAIDAHLVDQVAGIRARPGEMRIRDAVQSSNEENWVARRIAKLEEKRQRAIERLDLIQQARGEKVAEAVEAIRARIELLTLRIEDAQNETNVLATLRGFGAVDEMRRYLQQAHDHDAAAFRIAEKADRAVGKQLRANLTAGEQIGMQRARTLERIKDLTKKAQKTEADAIKKGDAETAALMDTLKEREAEVAEFIDRVKERQKQRLEAADRAEAMVTPRLQKLREDFRRDLRLKLLSYYNDRVEMGNLSPGARERAILTRGLRPGTVEGELFRFFTQFKAFPATFITKTWGRTLYGGGGIHSPGMTKLAAVAGVVHIMVGSLILGYLSMTAKDAIKGRRPRDPTDPAVWGAAIAQGGGLGIYGDFLMGDFSRFGRSPLETAVGPVGSTAADALELWSRVRNGDDVAAQGFRMLLDNTPYANLFWARWALNYLFLYQIQEALNPGSLRRAEARIKKENNQTYFIPPSRSHVTF